MKTSVGIEALAVALPRRTLHLEDLARARGVDPAKYVAGLGVREMAIRSREDTVAPGRHRAPTRCARRGPGVDRCWRGNRDRRRPQQAGRLLRPGCSGCRGRGSRPARLLEERRRWSAAEDRSRGDTQRAGHLFDTSPATGADRREPTRARVAPRLPAPGAAGPRPGPERDEQHPRPTSGRWAVASGGGRKNSIEARRPSKYRRPARPGRRDGDRPLSAAVAARAAGAIAYHVPFCKGQEGPRPVAAVWTTCSAHSTRRGRSAGVGELRLQVSIR